MKHGITAPFRGRPGYLWASLLLLLPCYWQPRLQAGDLSSHIYNAWLVRLIEQGRTQGLVAVWGLLFLTLIRRAGVHHVAAGIPFQFCVISAAAVFLLPGTVLIPGFYHALSGKFVVRSLEAGALCGNTRWKTLPDLLPIS